MRSPAWKPTATTVLVAILAGAGAAHLLAPGNFDPIVPSWMPGAARTTTYVSGVAELGTAALISYRPTRRIGGFLALATFVGVYPANIQAALDGGMKGLHPPLDSAAVAWLRLPLQFPLFWLAWRVSRSAEV